MEVSGQVDAPSAFCLWGEVPAGARWTPEPVWTLTWTDLSRPSHEHWNRKATQNHPSASRDCLLIKVNETALLIAVTRSEMLTKDRSKILFVFFSVLF
jgi:hypothetical protein